MPIYVKTNVLDKEDITSAGTFKNDVVRDGLQCYYDTNNYYSYPNGGATWYNIAANHSDLTVNGGMTTSTFNGVKGWNMNFDGAWLSGTLGGTQPNTYGTFEAWIYASASEVTSGDRGCIILLNGNCGQYMSWNKSSQYLSTYWYCSSDNGYHETNGPSARKTWVHWCTVWDPRANRLYQYVNGTSVGVAATTNGGASGTGISIGREGSSRQFGGSIAEIRIYSRALTPSEVMENYLSTRQKYHGITRGLLSWLDIGSLGSYSGSGSAITDLSGNSNNVNLYNGYSYSSSNEGILYFDGSGGMGIFNGGNSSGNAFAWSADGSIGNQSLTIEMWVKSSDTGGRYFSKPWNGSGQYNYWITPDDFFVYCGSSSTAISFGRTLSNNTWTHVVCWVNSTQYGYYINGGEYKGSANHGVTGAAPTSGNSNIPATLFSLYPYGSWGGNTGFSIDGYMGSTKVYNRVLSADEVGQAFRTQKARFGL
jgi:hypothetical protein